MRSLSAVEERARRVGPAPSSLVAALLAASFYPQLAYVRDPQLEPQGGAQGSRAQGAQGRHSRVELLIARDGLQDEYTEEDKEEDAEDEDEDDTSWTTAAARAPTEPAAASLPMQALVHPNCVGVRLNGTGWASPLLAFHELVRTSQLYVRDCTPAPPLAPLLFSGETLEVRDAPGGKELLLDGWLQIETSAAAASLVLQARRLVRGRWDRMVGQAAAIHAERAPTDRRGWTGRFSGQPLLDAIQPLLEQRALPAEPPKRRGGGQGLAAKKRAKAVFVPRRRKRSRMARYKKAW